MMEELYRHWDVEGNLLYVGISYSSVSRLKQHKKSAKWYTLVNKVTIERFKTRKEAEIAELLAIRTENPIHNIVGVVKEKKEDCVVLRWRKPKFKIYGKRYMRDEVVEYYKYILSMLQVTTTKYDLEGNTQLFKELFDLIKFSFKDGHGGRNILGGYMTTDNIVKSFSIDVDGIRLLLDAKDNMDIHFTALDWYNEERVKDNLVPNWYV